MSEYINHFPGYKCVKLEDGKYHNMYRGTDVGRGGYVYSEPGIYTNVALLDVQNMHGASIIALNKFGDHTKRFAEIREARNAIKTRNFDKARTLLDGKLAKYLDDETMADQLSNALKLVLNSAYGIAAASFDNPLRDPRDINNIIALRGALFMRTLQDEVLERGFRGVHFKTDSIKIPNATPEIIKFTMDFANKYGYIFEHEATYERICLIDKAQYVAAYMSPEDCLTQYGYVPGDNKKHFAKHNHPWTTTGDAFQHPYIFKKLFSGEDVDFEDMCEIKSVKDASMYLDFDENLPDVSEYEEELNRRIYNRSIVSSNDKKKKNRKLSEELAKYTDEELNNIIATGHDYRFVGRVGRFFPIRKGGDGGKLLALRNNKFNSINGAKGYRWLEALVVKVNHLEDQYDPVYFDNLINDAIKSINSFGSFDRFIDLTRPYEPPDDISPAADDNPPWVIVPCGDGKYASCMDCPNYDGSDRCGLGYSLATYVNEGGDN